MPSLSLLDLARSAIDTKSYQEFQVALADQELPGSFDILLDSNLAKIMIEQLEGGDITDWMIRRLTWDVNLFDPHAKLQPAEQLLHLLWQDLSSRLTRRMEAASHRTVIASSGAILCFFGLAELSLIVEYRKAGGGAVNFRPIRARRNPNAVLDFADYLREASQAARNALKRAAFSADKLVYHRGILVHVNRQFEDVFGPAIDTIILGELIAKRLIAHPTDTKISALEIGAGSGLLTVLMAQSPQIEQLVSVDINANATVCTLKNLQINGIAIEAKYPRMRVRAELFSVEHSSGPFDLVVCNPPYMPDKANGEPRYISPYNRATTGLGLSQHLLESLPALLTPAGELLLMTSSVAKDEMLQVLPNDYEAVPALVRAGRPVPLDLDDLWQESDRLQPLVADRRVHVESDESLWHDLHPLWIRKRRGPDHVG
jgi:release factor glutamine methyltransferase